MTSSYLEASLRYASLVFVAEGENIQAFFKVLKDLHAHKFAKVTIIYMAKTLDSLPFLGEIEFWKRSTAWNISIVLEQSVAPADWDHQKGDLRSMAAIKQLPCATKDTGVFLSVSPMMNAAVAEQLRSKAFKAEQIHGIN